MEESLIKQVERIDRVLSICGEARGVKFPRIVVIGAQVSD